MHILIVDDQPSALNVLKNMLLTGWPDAHIYGAKAVPLALEIVAEKPLDLIISDWQMPDLNGLDLIQRLNEIAPDIPVIIYSGLMISPADLELALSQGAVDYLRKPLDQTELIARVQNVLRLSSAYLNIKSLNQSKDLTFSVLSQHLITDVTKLGAALELIDHAVTPRKDYLDRLLKESRKAQLNQEQLLKDLLYWSRLRFNERSSFAQVFLAKPLFEKLCAPFNERLSWRVSKSLTLYCDPQLLQETLQQLLLYIEHTASDFISATQPIAVRVQAQAEKAHIEINYPHPLLEPEQLKQQLHAEGAEWGADDFKNGLRLDICKELLRLMNTQLQGSVSRQEIKLGFELPTASSLQAKEKR